MSNQREIEVKSLLGSQENAFALLSKMKDMFPSATLLHEEKQLNHYFKDGDLQKVYDKIAHLLSDEQKIKFQDMITHGKSHSVRTRWIHNKPGTILVIKSSLNEHSAHNGVSRMEFEPVLDMTIEQLDQLLLDCDFNYLSKWSRERQEYQLPDIHISLDKNAGYGYLAEFEMVIDADADIAQAQQKIFTIMDQLGAQELDQSRLERMFAFYNANRPDYYGTDKVFTIE